MPIQNQPDLSDFMKAFDRNTLRLHIVHNGCECGNDQLVSQKEVIRHSKYLGIFQYGNRRHILIQALVTGNDFCLPQGRQMQAVSDSKAHNDSSPKSANTIL